MIVDGHLRELARLTTETARFCRQHSLGREVEYDLTLAADELFVNSLQHGGCEGMEGAAEFHLELLSNGVALEYADRGTPFDPTSVPPPDLTASLDARSKGGLGIHLVRQT